MTDGIGVLLCSCDGMPQLLQKEQLCNTVAVEYLQHTLTATQTFSSHSGTLLYETFVAGLWDLDVVALMQNTNLLSTISTSFLL